VSVPGAAGAAGATYETDDGAAARILVVASDQTSRLSTLKWSPTVGRAVFWVAHDRPSAVQAALVRQPEVAIVELGLQECQGPAVALQIAVVARHVEPIFFEGTPDQGELAAAARDLGLGRVFPFSAPFANLERILVPLAESARLRRRLEEVEGYLRDLSMDEQRGAGPQRIALPEAERRYRETYVRSLLAETGSRREAARRAGIPYTTLCEIIRKLGIPDDPRP
jgi:hypothetical protein